MYRTIGFKVNKTFSVDIILCEKTDSNKFSGDMHFF